jgi:CHAD domain-containing protein
MGGARVRRYLAEQQETLLDASRLLAVADRSGVHPSRVAVRRARSTLRTFAACFDEGTRRQLDAALLAHARRLGTVRDHEVLVEVLDEQWARDDDVTPAGLKAWLSARLEADLETGWRETVALLAAEDGDELPRRFAALLAASAGGGGVRTRASHAARRAEHRLAAAGGDPEALHEARKAAKRARYAAEAVGDDDTADHFRDVQRVLGAHHDLVVAAQWVLAAPVLPAVQPDARQLGVRLEAAATDLLADLPAP